MFGIKIPRMTHLNVCGIVLRPDKVMALTVCKDKCTILFEGGAKIDFTLDETGGMDDCDLAALIACQFCLVEGKSNHVRIDVERTKGKRAENAMES